MLDFDLATKTSGSRFVFVKNKLARLERALSNFMIDVHTKENGYEEISPPLLANFDTMYGTGQLPKFESDQFEIKIDDNNRKYYRVLQLTDDDDCKAHCFVDMFDGRVYKPRTQTTANKKYWWDLDECLKIADCHGYYLNKDPEENMPL